MEIGTYLENSRITDGTKERFSSYSARIKERRVWPRQRLSDDFNFIYSQGGHNRVFKWRGIETYKSVYDLAIYSSLLCDLKPKTLIELGTGYGGSSIWYYDVLKSNGINTKIITFDIEKPLKYFPEIQYETFDVSNIDEYDFSNCEHPWLIIEDCHLHLPHILKTFDNLITNEDYIVIEDNTLGKQSILDWFMNGKDRYMIDTYYTDFYGYNNCSFCDAVLKIG
tara:strand:+ start:3823 stop:4494 length:672 start_codon:yes stop_codon:yes gene_type:complete